jgi:hypothetical protein
MSDTNLSPIKDQLTVVIANGAAASGDIYGDNNDARRRGFRGLSVETPSDWTPADIGFEVSRDNATWIEVTDKAGARVKITGITTNKAKLYDAPPEVWECSPYPYVRIVSLNTSGGANLNQGAARTLYVGLKR